jgi:hypothetical protein
MPANVDADAVAMICADRHVHIQNSLLCRSAIAIGSCDFFIVSSL